MFGGRLRVVVPSPARDGAGFQELHPPRCYDFAMTTDGAYEMADLFRMEQDMLVRLRWELTPPTAYAWLLLFTKLLCNRVRGCMRACVRACVRTCVHGCMCGPPVDRSSLR